MKAILKAAYVHMPIGTEVEIVREGARIDRKKHYWVKNQYGTQELVKANELKMVR